MVLYKIGVIMKLDNNNTKTQILHNNANIYKVQGTHENLWLVNGRYTTKYNFENLERKYISKRQNMLILIHTKIAFNYAIQRFDAIQKYFRYLITITNTLFIAMSKLNWRKTLFKSESKTATCSLKTEYCLYWFHYNHSKVNA